MEVDKHLMQLRRQGLELLTASTLGRQPNMGHREWSPILHSITNSPTAPKTANHCATPTLLLATTTSHKVELRPRTPDSEKAKETNLIKGAGSVTRRHRLRLSSWEHHHHWNLNRRKPNVVSAPNSKLMCRTVLQGPRDVGMWQLCCAAACHRRDTAKPRGSMVVVDLVAGDHQPTLKHHKRQAYIKTNPMSTSGALPLPSPSSIAGKSGSGPARRPWGDDQTRELLEETGWQGYR
jgi:hypothetical protein